MAMSATMTGGESQISPDGRYVVFVADRDTDEMIELYSVPLEGGEPTRLNAALINGGQCEQILDQPGQPMGGVPGRPGAVGRDELYSVPIGGGSPTKLNTTPVSGGDVTRFSRSPPTAREWSTAPTRTRMTGSNCTATGSPAARLSI